MDSKESGTGDGSGEDTKITVVVKEQVRWEPFVFYFAYQTNSH